MNAGWNATPEDLARLRHQMVEEQIARRGLSDPRLLAAFEKVPRHLFVPEELLPAAYADHPLPIDFGQTISQPYMVALMTHLLDLRGSERVLEVGTGSGYQSAILAHLAGEVHTVEFVPELAERAGKILMELGLANVHVHQGDGSLGWPEAAPFAGIIVTAAAPDIPGPLLEQMADEGRLVLPVGGRRFQRLQVCIRRGDKLVRRFVTGAAFVPLRGKYGQPRGWR
jgi:protein-L-isoaspartate(D-aspartate) O-methyltransferase